MMEPLYGAVPDPRVPAPVGGPLAGFGSLNPNYMQEPLSALQHPAEAQPGALFSGLLGKLLGGIQLHNPTLSPGLSIANHPTEQMPGTLGQAMFGIGGGAASAPAQSNPAEVNDLLRKYLAGLQDGTDQAAPASAGDIALPKPPTIQPADFSAVQAELEGLKPRPNIEDLPSHTYPGALSNEEQNKLISGAGWAGAAKGAMGAGNWLPDQLLGAGLGAIAGRQGEKATQHKEDVVRQEHQVQLDIQREDRNYDRQDRLDHDRMAWGLQRAGLDERQAKEVADASTNNAKLQYEYWLEEAKGRVEAAKELRPKVMMGRDGVAVVYTGKDGQQHVQMHPMNSGTADLDGLGGTSNDLQELQQSGGDPYVVGNMIVQHLDRRRLLSSVFSQDLKKSGADLGTIEQEVNHTIPPELRTMGASGKKEWLRRSKGERDAKLTEILMNTPQLMQQAVGMLRK